MHISKQAQLRPEQPFKRCRLQGCDLTTGQLSDLVSQVPLQGSYLPSSLHCLPVTRPALQSSDGGAGPASLKLFTHWPFSESLQILADITDIGVICSAATAETACGEQEAFCPSQGAKGKPWSLSVACLPLASKAWEDSQGRKGPSQTAAMDQVWVWPLPLLSRTLSELEIVPVNQTGMTELLSDPGFQQAPQDTSALL